MMAKPKTTRPTTPSADAAAGAGAGAGAGMFEPRQFQTRSRSITFRVTPREFDIISTAADRQKIEIADFIRTAISSYLNSQRGG